MYGNKGEQPESCDCCGRDAEDCGIDEHGWVTRDDVKDLSGTYCLSCAAHLRLIRWSEECVKCGKPAASERIAQREGWRYFADALGRLLPFCPGCAEFELELSRPSRTTDDNRS